MKNLDTESDALKKITDYLLEETLEPAKTEAERILEDAKRNAQEILEQTKAEQSRLIEQTRERIEKEQKSFYATMAQAVDQTVESLKQKILKDLFAPTLQQMVDKQMQKTDVIASLIDAIVKAIHKDGLSLDLTAFIPANASVQQVNASLTSEVLDKLRNHTVSLGKMQSGVEVKMMDKQITVEMTGKALQEALMNSIRKELRELIFKE